MVFFFLLFDVCMSGCRGRHAREAKNKARWLTGASCDDVGGPEEDGTEEQSVHCIAVTYVCLCLYRRI